jgi:hypothetical protein
VDSGDMVSFSLTSYLQCRSMKTSVSGQWRHGIFQSHFVSSVQTYEDFSQWTVETWYLSVSLRIFSADL